MNNGETTVVLSQYSWQAMRPFCYMYWQYVLYIAGFCGTGPEVWISEPQNVQSFLIKVKTKPYIQDKSHHSHVTFKFVICTFLFWQCNCNFNIWSFLLNPYWYAFILSHNIWSLLAMLWCFYMTSYEKRGLFTSCFEGFF